MSPDRADHIAGVILGAAIGDALGMPLDALSHQNVRTYYRGVRGFEGDEKRGDLGPGQFTGRTQFLLRSLKALIEGRDLAPEDTQGLRRVDLFHVPGAAIVAASGSGLWGWPADDDVSMVASRTIESLDSWSEVPGLLPAAVGQAVAVRLVLEGMVEDGEAFIAEVIEHVEATEVSIGTVPIVSRRLRQVIRELDAFPLDLQDVCGGSGRAADECWPFAIAIFARNPALVEANLLSAVNTGGDTPTVGACLGALLGAQHGVGAFPSQWVREVEDAAALTDLARRIASRG